MLTPKKLMLFLSCLITGFFHSVDNLSVAMKLSSIRLELSSSYSSFPFIPSSSSKISEKLTQKSGMPTFELFFFFVAYLPF